MRTDNDSWDITSSVGLTALGVAAARAKETQQPQPLSTDPFAAAFLAEAKADLPILDPTVPQSDELATMFATMTDYVAVRTRCFDDFFAAARADGAGQAVILAAGLDTRAFRTDMPAHTYELDQPAVLEFKDRVLREHGATARGLRTAIPVDLRHDWPKALLDNGFDPATRTAWLAEGLLPYLPPDARELLLTRVTELSATGSRIVLEHFTDTGAITESPSAQRISERLGMSVSDLFYQDEAIDPADLLRAQHWTVDVRGLPELAAAYGRTVTGDTLPTVQFVTATR